MEKYIERLNSIPMLIISGVFLLASFITEYVLPLMSISFEFVINPAWVSLIISGLPLAYAAVKNTLQRRITSVLLITIAMAAAVYIGDIFAAGEVAFIMAIGEWLEDRTVEKAKKGIEGLVRLAPDTGRRIYIDDNGNTSQEIVPSKDLCVGDVLRVLPGESFSADGVITAGNTTVDQSIITGESLPVDKAEGAEVFTGTINRFGSVDIAVTKSFADSSLQKMIKLVRDAENQKSPIQKIVDRWAGYLVPTACIIAVVTYVVFAFMLGMPDDALIRAVTVLVVFCPCALALATPTSIMAAIGQATKNGVLIKSGEALERMGGVTAVALDKTGTITHGRLEVSDILPYGVDEISLMALACSVESRSEHPIGRAVLGYANENNVPVGDICGFEMILGKGVVGQVGGQQIYCGNEKLIEDSADLEVLQKISEDIDFLRGQGKAVVIVASNAEILGVLGLSDPIKETSSEAVSGLHSAGIVRTVLLTGDNKKSAEYVAGKVGISEVYPSLLPEGKVDAVKLLMDSGEKICMVGDGVNDAPALKTATVGIAMGTMGSDIAIDAADIAIMGDDLSKIGYIKKLSNATIYSIKFNITLSMVINFGAIILSIAGLLTPATGALVHNAGSVLVVLNAARLYEKRIA